MRIGQPALAPLADSCYLNIAPAQPERSRSGMRAISADVLGIALYNQEITCGFAPSAMASVSCQDVEDGQSDSGCHNRYGLRKIMGQELNSVG
jgi:hypothetical protein